MIIWEVLFLSTFCETAKRTIGVRAGSPLFYVDQDTGQVQISVQTAGVFGPWEDVGTPVSDDSGGWSLKDVDLTAYAGETVRIGFLHQTDDGTASTAAGWYIDEVEIAVQ